MKIYLINQNNTNLYKIGITGRNIDARLKEIQTCNGYKVEVIHLFNTQFNRTLESALHRHYCPNQTIGEWFELNDEQVCRFLNECERLESMFELLKNENTYVQERNLF